MRWESAVVKEARVVGEQDPVLAMREREHVLVTVAGEADVLSVDRVPPLLSQPMCHRWIDTFVHNEASLLPVPPARGLVSFGQRRECAPSHGAMST
ncbi:MAG TPA: hypothetical protein VMT45_14965 [Thermoanaerobaculaceae bacterium]|nr:hypothetical protein [Thermoanaerobaculaceae bacterium]